MATAQVPVLSDDTKLHWLALRLVPGLGCRRSVDLIQKLRTPEAIFRRSSSELQAEGLSGSSARSIESGCVFDEAATQLDRAKAYGAEIIPFTDPRYPQNLREIYDPPLLLFAAGRTELLKTIGVGVVGTRRPTAYGLAVSERLAADLAAAGVTIVSGMARGIDTVAHKGALATGGDTIAVFGCGVDVTYPAENKKLHQEIRTKGLAVSEFPMGSPGYPQNFPVRNRIISGVSLGVVVVEGAQYSGSAITARVAMDQGREVFAVPGNVTSKMSWGPNLLIKQGAKLVQDYNDILVELPVDARKRLAAAQKSEKLDEAQQTMGFDGPMAELGREVLRRLKPDQPTHVDDVIGSLEHYSSSEVIAALFELELTGLIKQLPGRNFVTVW